MKTHFLSDPMDFLDFRKTIVKFILVQLNAEYQPCYCSHQIAEPPPPVITSTCPYQLNVTVCT